MIELPNSKYFAWGVYGFLFAYMIAAFFAGEGTVGANRWTLPIRTEPDLLSNVAYFLNYQPRFWSLIVALAAGAAFFALIGKLLELSRPLLYLCSLMLYFSAYGEVDAALTFLLFAQVPLLFLYPNSKGWRASIHQVGRYIVPIAVSIYFIFLAFRFMIQLNAWNGLWLFDVLFFEGRAETSSWWMPFAGYIVLLAHIFLPIAIWLRPFRMVVRVLVFIATFIYLLILGMWAMGILIVLGATLAFSREKS